MSEKWRMVGIAVVFLLAVGLAWFLLMDSGVEDGSAGRVGEPEFGGPVGEIPEFEFDEAEDSVVEEVRATEAEELINEDVIEDFALSVSGRVVEKGTHEPIEDFSILLLKPGQLNPPFRDSDFKAFHDRAGAFSVDDVRIMMGGLVFRSPGLVDVRFSVPNSKLGSLLEKPENIVIEMERAARLTGTVRNSNGEVLTDAYIGLGSLPGDIARWKPTVRATTDGDGQFSLDSIPPGKTVVSAWATGYLGETKTGTTGGHLDFVLTKAGSIEGYVLVDGKGKESVELLGLWSGGSPSVVGVTDSSGFYRITSLAEGTVRLKAILEGWARNRNLSAVIDVELGMATRFDFDFLPGRSSVEGYILDAENMTGRGAARVTIDTGAGRESHRMDVGYDGHYYFYNIPAGAITVRGSSRKPRGSSKLVRAELGDNETLRLDVNLFTGVTVKCMVTDVPAGYSVEVFALPLNYPVPTTVTRRLLDTLDMGAFRQGYLMSAGDGSIEFEYMDAGDYTIVARTSSGRGRGPYFTDDRIASSELHVSGDEDVGVTLSFLE